MSPLGLCFVALEKGAGEAAACKEFRTPSVRQGKQVRTVAV